MTYDNNFDDDDVLANLSVENTKTFKESVFIKPKADFKINQTKDFHIVRGFLIRQFFKGKTPMCKSWNGEIGKARDEEGKFRGAEKECKTCPYLNGVIVEGQEEKIKCNPGYTLILEHPDPEKEYNITINKESQINLENYRSELKKMGLKVDQVITGFTRDESQRSPVGFAFKFNLVRELKLDYTEAEKDSLNEIISSIKEDGESLSSKKIADILMKYKPLKDAGISQERATRLAVSIADANGMITEEAKFV